jgi:hypothetical protein
MMGLDWQPLGKPRLGHEAEFDALYEELFDNHDQSLWERMGAIEISPYETLGAPRVGIDPEADRWADAQYSGRPWKKLFVSRRKFRQVLHGYYVLDLVEKNDGVPAYSNGGIGSYCEIFSFRGKFLAVCEDVLGKDLLGEAWVHHRADELNDYGIQLRDRAAAFAEDSDVTEVLGQRYLPSGHDPDGPAEQAHIVDSAARWCLFWSARGHGMIADF